MTNVYLSWVNGLSAFVIVVIAWIFFIRDIFRYRNHKNSIYINGMMIYLSMALGWSGISISFLSVLFLGQNAPWIRSVFFFFSYCTLPIGSFAITSSSWDLVGSPMNKKHILIVAIIISVIYYITFFIEFPYAIHISRLDSINEVYDDWVNPMSFFFVFIWLQTMISTIICALGWHKFRKLSTGKLKERTNFLIIAIPIFGCVVLADTVVPGHFIHAFVFIPRFILVIGTYLLGKSFRPN
ncbi:MAG: hypothetical protein JW891_15040 [Candidatus Lokiarchaeota archaeon]|nr:hypothetical protein [Candidatus Lokiarchaeota archaeon]